MHKHLPPAPPPITGKTVARPSSANFLYRMKNHNAYNGGIADCWYSGVKRDLWVEYKFVVVPKRPDTVIVPGLSDLQFDWLLARHLEGRNVAVIVGCKEGGVRLQLSQWRGLSTRDFTAQVEPRRSIAEFITRYVNSP